MDEKWIEIKIITKSETIDPVSGIFYGLGVKGVAIEDPNDVYLKQKHPGSWDYIDADIFEFGDKVAVIKGYFNENEDIDGIIEYTRSKLDELKDMGIDIGQGKIITSEVFEKNWANSWKKYYKTTKLGRKIVIKPIWEDYTPQEDEIIVQLDPGMAFGTGTHETTMMCVELIEKYIQSGDTVFDIGTGSGILAITAAKLGAGKVIGVDLDEVAVKSAKENVEYNNITKVSIRHGNLTDVLEEKANLIVANIIADVIIDLCQTIKPFIAEDGLFIASGIINDRKDDVLKALEKEKFKVVEIKEMGEWVAIATKLN